jgi:hypothetical protein
MKQTFLTLFKKNLQNKDFFFFTKIKILNESFFFFFLLEQKEKEKEALLFIQNFQATYVF